jgi:polyisoprenyl-phosphate glycosyltransferase
MRNDAIEDAGLIRLSVVAPCFNEAEGLAEFHRRVSAVARREVGEDYEVVLVNDGSRDETWAVIWALAQQDPHLYGINLARNFGHQAALSAGLMACCGERILVIDADLQDPPELLGEMIRLMDAGADVVYGQRTARLKETWFKRASARLFYRLLDHLVDHKIPLDTGDFRLMSRRVLEVLNAMPEHHRFIRGMVSWIGFRQVPVPYQREERFAGRSHYPFAKMARFAADAITSFSTKPLRIASLLGVAFGLLAIVALVFTLASWMVNATIPGWTSLMTVILVLGSAQLLMVGVLGEYIGRLYMESKRRPLFVLSDTVHRDAVPSPHKGRLASAGTDLGEATAADAVLGAERAPGQRRLERT